MRLIKKNCCIVYSTLGRSDKISQTKYNIPQQWKVYTYQVYFQRLVFISTKYYRPVRVTKL